MNKKVSLREYARIRGVHLNAVQTTLKSGRIHKTPDGKIDVEEANKEWFINTDPAKSHKADPLFDGGADSGKQNFSTFQHAKTADIYYRTMLAKAKLKMIMGETIALQKAKELFFKFGRSLRDIFMSFSTWYGAEIAAELGVDEHKMIMVLEKYEAKLLSETRDIIERDPF